MKLNKRKIYQVFRDTQVEDDCQRKFNLDSGIIYFSSRGYDREEKSIYVSFYLKQYKDSFDNEHFIELLKDELFADSKEELVFYSNATTDIEYKYSHGWGELWGIADRTDYDLKTHIEHSKADLTFLDPETNQKYIPYVIEPSVGVDRLFLAILTDAYEEETLEDKSVREVMHFHPFLAPYKAAVLPLVKKHHKEKALEIYKMLSQDLMVIYDETGNIGKRYRREDIAGTPYCITVDDETINNGTVTVRDRDTMKQEIIKVENLKDYLNEKIKL